MTDPQESTVSDDPIRPLSPVWETPPPPPKGRYGAELSAFVAALRERPGQWAKLAPVEGEADHPTSRGTTLKRQDPQLEVRAITVPGSKPQRVFIWARWVPPAEKPASP